MCGNGSWGLCRSTRVDKLASTTLLAELRRTKPDLEDPESLIREGQVLVNGYPVRNPASRIAVGSTVAIAESRSLHGELKLESALQAFDVSVEGRVALDVGAAAGGFTTALLKAGAARVYAVDAGHGQLLGSLRQNPRVVNLEATNLGKLDCRLIPETVSLVVIDVSYLSLAEAFPQLGQIRLAPEADLIALVKPMFELKLPMPPTQEPELQRALAEAVAGAEKAGWHVAQTMPSPVLGHKGAREFLLHAVKEPEPVP